jgi:hypothetical protein
MVRNLKYILGVSEERNTRQGQKTFKIMVCFLHSTKNNMTNGPMPRFVWGRSSDENKKKYYNLIQYSSLCLV